MGSVSPAWTTNGKIEGEREGYRRPNSVYCPPRFLLLTVELVGAAAHASSTHKHTGLRFFRQVALQNRCRPWGSSSHVWYCYLSNPKPSTHLGSLEGDHERFLVASLDITFHSHGNTLLLLLRGSFFNPPASAAASSRPAHPAAAVDDNGVEGPRGGGDITSHQGRARRRGCGLDDPGALFYRPGSCATHRADPSGYAITHARLEEQKKTVRGSNSVVCYVWGSWRMKADWQEV